MNRCFSFSLGHWLAALFACLAAAAAPPLAAQTLDPQRIPPIAAKAERGVLRVVAPPDVLMDGRPARLAPGARIRDRNNLMVVSGALTGQDLLVRYTRDPLGLVHEVWVLTAAEAAALNPPRPALPAY
ncbi:MAG: hypothetical protein Q8R72_03870 [Hylemonella sp.]|nr:hypothetical protein [Hylemonella sp.]